MMCIEIETYKKTQKFSFTLGHIVMNLQWVYSPSGAYLPDGRIVSAVLKMAHRIFFNAQLTKRHSANQWSIHLMRAFNLISIQKYTFYILIHIHSSRMRFYWNDQHTCANNRFIIIFLRLFTHSCVNPMIGMPTLHTHAPVFIWFAGHLSVLLVAACKENVRRVLSSIQNEIFPDWTHTYFHTHIHTRARIVDREGEGRRACLCLCIIECCAQKNGKTIQITITTAANRKKQRPFKLINV